MPENKPFSVSSDQGAPYAFGASKQFLVIGTEIREKLIDLSLS